MPFYNSMLQADQPQQGGPQGGQQYDPQQMYYQGGQPYMQPQQPYMGQPVIPQQPAVPVKPPRQRKELTTAQLRKRGLIFFFALLAVVGIVLLSGRIAPGIGFLNKNLPASVASYVMNDRTYDAKIKDVKIKKVRYELFGGVIDCEVTTEDEYLERELAVRVWVKGVTGFWKVSKVRFTEDYADKITLKDGFFEKVLEGEGFKENAKVENHTNRTFDSGSNKLEMTVESEEKSKQTYMTATLSYRLTGYFSQSCWDRKKRTYTYTIDERQEEIAKNAEWHLDGNYANSEIPELVNMACTIDGDRIDFYMQDLDFFSFDANWVDDDQDFYGNASAAKFSEYHIDQPYREYNDGFYLGVYAEPTNVIIYTSEKAHKANPERRYTYYTMEFDMTAKDLQDKFGQKYQNPTSQIPGSLKTPDINGEVLYIYSTDPSINDVVTRFLEKYPLYEDMIDVVDCSGMSYEEYEDRVNSSFDLEEPAGIVAMEEQQMGSLGESSYRVLTDLGITPEMCNEAYDYTIKIGSVNGDLKAMAWTACPGAFLYRTDIAEKVFGTSDPETIEAMTKDWDSFVEMAQKLKDAGYYTLSSKEDLFYGLNRKKNDELEKALADIGAFKDTTQWSEEWYESMGQDVFGFFGPQWLFTWVICSSADSYGFTDKAGDYGWGAALPPEPFHWGGSYLAVPESCQNPELAALFLYTACCDQDVAMALGKISQTQPNHIAAVKTLIDEECPVGSTDIVKQNNTFRAFHENGMREQ